MAARKLQQEVDKCFKKVEEGVAEFESIYEKIEQSNNQPQKEKLEDNLKREIKKLQRLRDQIKTWAASNDIKDKAPLLEKRKLIETQMEKFKAVEKAMKTKAYSKEGLSAAAKLDPKEQAKLEASEFLSTMVDELEQQLESLEAENESIQVTMKKGKNQGAKADRMATIEGIIERHKWHQGKLELIRRSLENGGVEPEQVTELEESIRYYVSDGTNDDYVDDDELYDELNLQEDEEVYGMPHDNDKSSSQDNQSVHEDSVEPERASSIPGKTRTAVEATAAVGRRPSAQAQVKSPLPQLAQLSSTPASLLNTANGGASTGMKPAALPARPAGETLKYASAAAAAADKNNVGIAPLPPPPGSQPASSSTGISPLPVLSQGKASAVNSPALAPAQPVPTEARQPTPAEGKAAEPKAPTPPPAVLSSKKEKGKKGAAAAESSKASQINGHGNGTRGSEEEDEEPIYYLPSSLSDLLESYEVTKNRPLPANSRSQLRMLAASQQNVNGIDNYDTEPPRTYKPEVRVPSSGYPQEPLQIFDDPRLYSRIEPDTLFYVFYYKQGTSQQYLAAKALKDQSWRFHKQYQTWFQRHEEPKNITEEFEQGTYRFFDYESTWMNRRKADFKFAYRFLEDDV
ncbi:Not1 N-terminal domain, CCR4-Not complex component-domain-containing protein [Microdochium trichocladiopsis]|uniref:General negative regulator of transcription subunit n=1 Tax=Microdochium trichocladiopsis TaxID=1682393 RepID=A0A9P8XZ83_9PEZI|nr:Not1 N-terminal domain, CCR4-Not complex component-domain-containing protein [Microdochium trichocladiopsis]KAH7026430.1 Not1 N-terminal domain, CCR4-Not complex component-domain-containing protein [Microdochium trichocladiopsis]